MPIDAGRGSRAISLEASSPTARRERSTFKLTAADGDFLSKLALPFAFAVPVSTPSHPSGRVPSRPRGRTGSPRTGRRPRCSASFATRGSASGRPTRSREGFPDTITDLVGAMGSRDTVGRVRAVEARPRRCHDVGTGPPAGEGGARPARGPVPGPASPQHGLQHGVLLPQHPHPAVRRRARPPRGQQRLRPARVRGERGCRVRADVPDPATQLPRVRAGAASTRPAGSTASTGPKAGQTRRRGRRPRHRLDAEPEPPARRNTWRPSSGRSDSAQTSKRSRRRGPARSLLHRGRRSSEPGPDRLRRMVRGLSVGGRLHPAAPELRRVSSRPHPKRVPTSPASATRRSTRR